MISPLQVDALDTPNSDGDKHHRQAPCHVTVGAITYTLCLFIAKRENRWKAVDPNRRATGLLLPVR